MPALDWAWNVWLPISVAYNTSAKLYRSLECMAGYCLNIINLDCNTINTGVRSGKPCVRNLRITVADVLGYLASGMSHEKIISDFPELTEEDIRACLSYAADSEKHIKIIVG